METKGAARIWAYKNVKFGVELMIFARQYTRVDDILRNSTPLVLHA